MKEKVEKCLKKSLDKMNVSTFRKFGDARKKALGVKLFSYGNKRNAEELLDKTKEEFQNKQDIISLSYLLLAAKELGYTKNDMEDYINLLENEKKNGLWSNQIWLNSLVATVLGKYGITYPNLVNFLEKERMSNGSWYNKVWVSSYGLKGLFYSNAETPLLSKTADYIKNAINKDYWKKERSEKDWISKERVTALALESLLLIGEGYTEEPLKSAIEWSIKRINTTKDEKKVINLSVPLTYIAKGDAHEKTSYRESNPVHFRETKVEIGEKVEGDKVSGDLIDGDKVKEKLGEKATQVIDSVTLKSDIGGGENDKAEVQDSIVKESSVGGDSGIPLNYSIFTGKKIDGKVKFCPKCGSKIKEEWSNCANCGQNLDKIKDIFD